MNEYICSNCKSRWQSRPDYAVKKCWNCGSTDFLLNIDNKVFGFDCVQFVTINLLVAVLVVFIITLLVICFFS